MKKKYLLSITVAMMASVSALCEEAAMPISSSEANNPCSIGEAATTASEPESATVSLNDSTQEVVSTGKLNIFQKFMKYMNNMDDNAVSDKDVSYNFIGGPFYGSDIKFAVAITGTVNYRTRGCDKQMEPSFASTYAQISTSGFWSMGVYGTTFFNQDKSRFNYDTEFGYAPRDYYGIGYDNAIKDENRINLNQKEAMVHLEYVYSLFPKFFVGPSFDFLYGKAGKDVPNEVLDGKDRVVRSFGPGVVLQYDSRDLITNASRGVYAHLSASFNPKFLANKYPYTRLDFTTSYYHTAWRDAIIAAQVNAKFNFGDPSWAMMSLFGDNAVMRGYYKGRFRDKHTTSMQVELRQHVWKRSGLVVWGGVGNVFHDKDSFKHFMPNYGIGYRFEFRRKMNIRLDYGVGAHGQSSVVFSMNEAF